MSDALTEFENRLEKLYNERVGYIADAGYVKSYEDYTYRAGYLQCIRDIGTLIKEIRNPVEIENG